MEKEGFWPSIVVPWTPEFKPRGSADISNRASRSGRNQSIETCGACSAEFGDAELAGLIAPRALIVEASRGPEITGPPAETEARKGATPNGKLISNRLLPSVEAEVERARPLFAGLKAKEKLQLVVSDGGSGLAGSEAALTGFVGITWSQDKDTAFRRPCLKICVRIMMEQSGCTGSLISLSTTLNGCWEKRRRSERRSGRRRTRRARSAGNRARSFTATISGMKSLAACPPRSAPANPRTRHIYDEPKFKGYEVMLDVWPDVFAYGILLVPKDLRPWRTAPGCRLPARAGRAAARYH